MAPPSGRRRTRTESEEDDDDSESDRYGTPSVNADSPKRPRLSSDFESDSSEDGPQTNGRAANGSAAVNGNSLTDFQPGAIVRVTVENFVTYEKAEFFPGPNLNMVIGPNGTGKSSLVCAICLGLGYSPKHLGRAGSVKEFVKHGKDTATIEIELQKRPKDRSNHVIRVVIRREQNNQKWWLNGKESTHKAIMVLMRSLNIQVDNLCQFLPQDRVVEFAACTPVDLLRETLRAAAPQQMLDWQKQLRDLHKDKKVLTEASQTDIDTLRNLESRQQGLQADVDRLREREEIQERVKNLRGALIVSKYLQAREKHNRAKERKKEAERSLKRLEEESGPSLEAVNHKQVYAQQIEAAVSGRTQVLSDVLDNAQGLGKDVLNASENMKQFENEQASERKGFDERRKEFAASRSKITALEADRKNQPPAFNAAEWNQKIRAEEHTLRELEGEEREASSQISTIKDQGKAIVAEMRKLKADLDSFDTQEGQQMNFMKKNFPEVASGWEWVQENQDKFDKEVFGPPMISCSLKDERYSDQVQSMLMNDDFLCFTAQTKDDYKRLSDQLYRVMSLSVNIRTCTLPLDTFKRPVGPEEMAALGFDGFAVDYLEGPAPVLAMLCAEKRLHLSGVTLQDHTDAQYERLVNNGRVNQWAAGRQSYTIRRRREYGPQAMTTITKPIHPGRFWTSQPIDSHEKAQLNRRLAEAQGEKDILKDQIKERQDKTAAFGDQKDEIMNKIEELKREKNALQREYQKWQSLPDKIESEERNKAACEEAMRDARKKMLDLRYKCNEATVKRAKLVLRHKDAVSKIREAHHALLEAQIRHIEAKSDIAGLKLRSASIMERLDQEKANVQEALREAEQTRVAGRLLGEQVRDEVAAGEDRQRLLTELAGEKSPEEVEMEIEAEEANLELIHAANPNVIREFERRAQEIERLQSKMGSVTEKLASLDVQLQEVMGKWEPQLDELVSKINDAFAYNFEQISCAGEIRVHKDPDFDLWALDIMVRFRENETLQKLTAHRQSGGERAVSTIFYLMALQSMAQSPFRVVDEINQGMDPRNERMVHERMVEIACREHTSQYFLITPKLLTGLRYDPKMRVLCIASGEHMPREGRKLDFARCLKVQKGLMAGA